MEHDIATDCAIAVALAERQDSAFDRSLATVLQQEELENHRSAGGSGAIVPILCDEAQLRLDRTVSERLAEAVGVQHRPRTNSAASSEELCFEDASTDRDRLLGRLATYSLCEREVKGDGNCQFRALSDQLYCTPVHHAEVRAAAVAQLRAHPEIYSPYVEGGWESYLRDMAKSGTWGDHITLQAVADYFGVKIFVLTSYAESEIIEIYPRGPLKSKRVLYLSFWAEVHYNSVFPQAEPPAPLPHDKTLGSRRLHHLLHREVY